MSNNVVDLGAARADKAAAKEDPHMHGLAVCLACGHEHTAVAPVGMDWMQCPKCHLIRVRFVYPILRAGDHWRCFCNDTNTLFRVTAEGIYCPNCGKFQKPFE